MTATANTSVTSALTRGPGGEPARGYATLTRLYHPKLSSQQLGSFFKLCRLQGVSFDLRSKTGTVFNVVDSLSSGLIAIVTVATGADQALAKITKIVEFFSLHIGTRTAAGEFQKQQAGGGNFDGMDGPWQFHSSKLNLSGNNYFLKSYVPI